MRLSRFLRLVSVFGLFVWLSGCTSTQPEAIPSPDGRFVLVTMVNTDKTDPRFYLCVKFEIRDSAGQLLYAEQTHASVRMRWSMRWEGNERVVLESSDIGTYAWERGHDGQWHKVP